VRSRPRRERGESARTDGTMASDATLGTGHLHGRLGSGVASRGPPLRGREIVLLSTTWSSSGAAGRGLRPARPAGGRQELPVPEHGRWRGTGNIAPPPSSLYLSG
jgi:hypothetical protein